MSHLRPIDQWFMDQILPLEPMLLASARKLVNDPDAARDLVQEAFARLLTVEGWAQIEAPHPYLLRMMRNLAFEKLRRAKIARFEQLTLAEDFDVVDESPDAFRVLSGREQLAQLDAALKDLPERCRRVFVMRRIEERSPREIAKHLGVSPSTLEKRLARAHYLVAKALAPTPALPLEDRPAKTDEGRRKNSTKRS
ncbi:RNA polymerase sigma factor [Caulobacter sp. UNC279MFTsu5.1]|uniref:RNA polymerase sigma factor n=1 Tax=Caulobacter sp. UNC279MFTsu5.1 TaxID=1502775 RepID=UPI0008EF5A33|nr:sigma-70 family RNA polymerase sigma factor [Caulobacter sp. UNC279MFTsu5.1]SFI54621.1 RNA polymerase sigma-70 factor, ECF subfamily [Caulobacter sp. UNC279MFTsu5.1]